MKRKLLLIVAAMTLFACFFAISVSAAAQNYGSFEVILQDDTRVTVYTAGAGDIGNGWLNLSETIYSEAPVDSEGTYATVAWSQVKEIDFTVTGLYIYNSKTDLHDTYTGGTNGTANGSVNILKAWDDASVFNTVKKVNTGNAYGFGPALFKGWQGIETVVFGYPTKTISDSMFENSSVANIIFDENCQIYRCNNSPFANCDNIVSVDFPDSFTYLGNSGLFSGCDNLERVGWPSNCPAIPGSAFSNCKKLTFEIPDYITEIKGSAFSGCTSITSVVIPSTVTAIGNDCFRNCYNLTSVVFEEGCSVTKLYAHTFDSCAFSEITLPNTVKQLKQTVFANNSNLRVINLGASLVDFNLDGNKAASLCSSGIEKIYLSASFVAEAVRADIFGNDDNLNDIVNLMPKLVIYYTGDKAAADAIIAASTVDGVVINGVFASMTVVSLEEYEALEAAGTLSGRYMIYGYNKCDAFYNGVHAEGQQINPCQFGCGRDCGMAELLDNPQHELSKVTAFGTLGYFGTACVTESCSICKTVTFDESVEAIFVDYGYSMTESAIGGKLSMSQFFGINKANLDDYIEATGNTFEFGFVVSSNNDPMNAENSGLIAEGKTYITDQSKLAHDYFAVTVVGFTDATVGNALTFCVYVKDGDKVSYLDNGETVQTVEMKSYNDVKALLNKGNTEVTE